MKFPFILISVLLLPFSSDAQKTIVLRSDLTSVKDAMIADHLAGNNLYYYPNFYAAVWTHGGVPSLERSCLWFDLSSLPADAILVSATLYLLADPAPQFSSPTKNSTNNACMLRRITESWDDKMITWNNQPPTTTKNQVLLEATSNINKNETVDILALIKDMLSTPSGNFGLMISTVDEVTLYNCRTFYSSDHAVPWLRPRLEITYTEKTTGPVDPDPDSSGTPDKSGHLKVYELITPDQNGKNDYLYIEGLENFKSHEVFLYSQWGTMVFHSTDYAGNWNGADLPEGTYYYIVKVTGPEKELKGSLYIDR